LGGEVFFNQDNILWPINYFLAALYKWKRC